MNEPTTTVANGMLPKVTERDTVEVTFRGGPAFDNGKTRQLHVSKCDGEEFITSGGSVMGDAVPDRVHIYRDGEAHFVRWAH